MLTEPQKMWVATLRSGEYQQGVGFLCQGDNYCCLGVACDLYIKHVDPEYPQEDQENADGITRHTYGGAAAILPHKVQVWLGLKELSGMYGDGEESLASLNDQGKTFAEIADLIESEPEGLFVAKDSQDDTTSR